MPNKYALIVDDTEANRFFFERLLIQAGYTILSAGCGAEAMARLSGADSISVAIVDLEIGDMSGFDLTRRLRELHPDACVVMATMHDERTIMDSAFAKGCDIFLVKPHGFVDLYKRLTAVSAEDLRVGTPLIIDQYGVRRYLPVTI